jgi:hypothetical protein
MDQKAFLGRQIISGIFLVFPGVTYSIYYFFGEFLLSHILTAIPVILFVYLNFLSSLVALIRFAKDYWRQTKFSRLISLGVLILLAVGGLCWTGYWVVILTGLLTLDGGKFSA